MKKLLGDCTDICDVRDLTDKTLLHYCFKHESCAELILNAAPELLDVGEKNGYTVLHLSSMMKPPISLKYLLSKNPDINKRNNDQRSSLLLAVIYDNYDALKLLCDHKAEVNISDVSGVSPLHYAAKIKAAKDSDNETLIIDLLLEYGGNIECLDFYERSPLVWAVCSNNIAKMNHLITKGANIYAKDAGGLSVLHYATSNGNIDIIRILLEEYKFDIETLDNNKCSALMYACSYTKSDVIQFLLEKGANVNAEDCKRRNGAHFASGKGDLNNLEILHKFNCNLWKLNQDSNYPLHEAAYKGHFDVLEFLINNLNQENNYHSIINHKNSNGQTALHLATVKDNVKICSILLDHGADPNIQLRVINGKSMTALDLATKDETKSLIVKHNGQTSDNLMKASVISEELTNSTTEDPSDSEDDETDSTKSCNKDEDVFENEKECLENDGKENKSVEKENESFENDEKDIKSLGKEDIPLEDDLSGAKSVEKEDTGLTVLNNEEKPLENVQESLEKEYNLLKDEKQIEKEEMIDERPSSKTDVFEITDEYQKILFTSCYSGSVDEIMTFIKRGGSLGEIIDKTGKSLLHYSLKNQESFKIIVETAPQLINQPDHSNLTILHMVIMSKQTDQLYSLLDNNADYNFQDSNGRTALHLAVIYDNLDALRIMNAHVSDKTNFLQKPDVEGNYPLHYAVEMCKLKKTVCRCKEYIELLLTMNGEVECRDNVNRTPLLLAINIKNVEAVLTLLQYGANTMAKDNQNLCSVHYVCSEGSLDIFNELAKLEEFDPNIADPNGLTPIFYAISNCNEKIVKRLIGLNARLDMVDQYGRNICHKAAEKGAFKCLELLLSYNVNPWLKSEEGNLPLHEAAYRGYKEIAEILLNTTSAMDYINIKNNSGQTALHLAAVRNDCPMCFLLISKGSNVNELLHNTAEDGDLTAYDLATTPYCKDTLYTFGGRSAKRIIECISLDNESECDRNLEELAFMRIDNSMFIPRTSVRSTELALSTMPSVVNTVRTNEISSVHKSSHAQPLASPKKSEYSLRKHHSVASSDKYLFNSIHSETGEDEAAVEEEENYEREEEEEGVGEEKEENVEEVQSILENNGRISVALDVDIESELRMKSDKLSYKKSSRDSQLTDFSELSKFQKSVTSSKTAPMKKCSSRPKSFLSNGKADRIHSVDKMIMDKVQGSVINYEYARLNCKVAVDLARERIRRENIKKLMNPKTPKSVKSSKLRKPKLMST